MHLGSANKFLVCIANGENENIGSACKELTIIRQEYDCKKKRKPFACHLSQSVFSRVSYLS